MMVKVTVTIITFTKLQLTAYLLRAKYLYYLISVITEHNKKRNGERDLITR